MLYKYGRNKTIHLSIKEMQIRWWCILICLKIALFLLKVEKKVKIRNTGYEKRYVMVMLCITAYGHK
jgi:hypothetical protein